MKPFPILALILLTLPSFAGRISFRALSSTDNADLREDSKNLLRKLLKSRRIDERRVATRIAEKIAHEDLEVQTLLIETLSKEDGEDVIQRIVNILIEAQPGPHVQKRLLDYLFMNSQKNSYWMTFVLGNINPSIEVQEILMNVFLEQKSEEDMKKSANALIAIGSSSPQIYKPLLGAFQNEKREAFRRGAIASALGGIGHEDPTISEALLRALLKDENKIVRSKSVRALARRNPQDSKIHQGILKALLKEEDDLVRIGIASSLVVLKPQDPKIYEALKEALLKGKHKGAREMSVYILSKLAFDDPDLEGLFLKVLSKEEDGRVKEEVISSWQKHKAQTPAIYEALIERLLKDESEVVRLKAIRTLSDMNLQDPEIHKDLLKAFLKERDDHVRIYIASALAMSNSQDPEIHKTLKKALFRGSNKIRERSAYILSKLIPVDSPKNKTLFQIALQRETNKSVRRMLESILEKQ